MARDNRNPFLWSFPLLGRDDLPTTSPWSHHSTSGIFPKMYGRGCLPGGFSLTDKSWVEVTEQEHPLSYAADFSGSLDQKPKSPAVTPCRSQPDPSQTLHPRSHGVHPLLHSHGAHSSPLFPNLLCARNSRDIREEAEEAQGWRARSRPS